MTTSNTIIAVNILASDDFNLIETEVFRNSRNTEERQAQAQSFIDTLIGLVPKLNKGLYKSILPKIEKIETAKKAIEEHLVSLSEDIAESEKYIQQCDHFLINTKIDVKGEKDVSKIEKYIREIEYCEVCKEVEKENLKDLFFETSENLTELRVLNKKLDTWLKDKEACMRNLVKVVNLQEVVKSRI